MALASDGHDGDPLALVRDMYAAFNRRDVDAFVSHLSPNVRWYTLDMQIQPRFLRGREEVRAFVASLLASAAVFTADPEELRHEGELVLARICHRSRRRPSDPETAYRVVHLWTVRGDSVVKHRFYLAIDKAMKAVAGRRASAAARALGADTRSV